MKPKGHIENWQLIGEGSRLRLVGLITSHHRLQGSYGKVRTTSPIISIDTAAGTASTLNTDYTLGIPFTPSSTKEKAYASD